MTEALTEKILNLWNHKDGDFVVSSIWIADTASKKSSRRLTSGNYLDVQPKWSLDGTFITFVSNRVNARSLSTIYLLRPGSTANPRAITPIGREQAMILGYEFSPDGKFIVFLSHAEKSAEQKAKEQMKDDATVWGKHTITLVYGS
ncbi:hypothetical protein PT974_03081 [Cladobotryum mycophilum]|uniref:Uncharacterized protein n=1 Tax=Cladobotryum mycophilum TaxID=491253 RepID=A0ABR0SVY3_9HYPO